MSRLGHRHQRSFSLHYRAIILLIDSFASMVYLRDESSSKTEFVMDTSNWLSDQQSMCNLFKAFVEVARAGSN